MNKRAPSASQTRRNVAAIWANRLLAGLAPVITAPLVVNHFGLGVTGVWLLATQLASHLMLLDAGISNSLMRLLARPQAAAAPQHAAQVVATSFYTLLGLGALLLLLAGPISSLFVSAFRLDGPLRDQAWWLMLLTVASVAVTLPLRVGYGLLGSRHRFDLIQLWEGIAIALRLGLIVAVFYLARPTLLHLGLIVFGCSVASVMAVFAAGIRGRGKSTLSLRAFSRSALSEMFSMSMAAMLVTLAAVLLTQASSTLTGYFIGTPAVALLAFPLMIYTSVTPFFSTFSLIAGPIAAAMSSQEERAALLELYVHSARYLASAAFLLLLGVLVFGERVLQLWLSGPSVDADAIKTMARVLAVVLLGFALSNTASIGRAILASVGRHWSAAIAELVTSLLGLAIGGLLATVGGLGVLGMALGITCTLAIRGLLWFPFLMGAHFECRGRGLVLQCLGRPTLIALATAAMGAGIDHLRGGGPESGIAALIAAWTAPFVLWSLATWRFVLTAGHRSAVCTYMARLTGR